VPHDKIETSRTVMPNPSLHADALRLAAPAYARG
jgi:hypothetical protein